MQPPILIDPSPAYGAGADAGRTPTPLRTAVRDGRRLILDLAPEEFRREIGALLEKLGERPYRAGQLREWVYVRRAGSFEEMSNLPISLRGALAERYVLSSLSLEERAASVDGTEKFLWRLADGREVESVSIPGSRKLTYCISSQVGCPLACSFCATGKLGYTRQLTAGEIVDQVRSLLRLTRGALGETAGREPNLVFMGMGEPLLNLRNVLPALAWLTADEFLNLGARRITVSTAGVAPRIADLSAFNPQIKLAVSLHAPEDELRDDLVPLNRRHPLTELMAACRAFARATGKRITFEYIHLPGVNDRPGHPAALRDLLEGIPAKINLIPYNPVPGLPHRAPTERESEAFLQRLQGTLRCSVTLRRPRGRDIGGACGQLELERHPERLVEPLHAVGG
ncbi:MAG: 23S rRNA (adenine(2503)-C(2))-methyltransferase RlmN [Gemmatimonadota bacterium]